MSAEDEDRPEPSAKVGYWLSEIKRAQNCQAMRQWHERCIKIRKLYRDEQSADRRKRKYAMLWSNMETMKPSIYAKPPKGVVQRRYKDSDRVGRVASELLERAVNFTFDVNDFDSRLKQVRDDYLLYARGVARLYYEPVMDTVADEDDESGLDDVAVQGPAAEIADDREEAAENENPGELLAFENVKIRYVQRTDFVHQEARTWDEVDWVAFRGYLDRDGLIDRFGEEIGKTIPIEAPSNAQRDMDEPAQAHKAEIWEIWDRCEERVLWICKGYGEVLEEGPPYLKLDGFYPCPRPAYGTLTNDSLAPVPDYTYYQDQVEEIDRLTDRIAAMTEALKLVGFYPAGPQGEGAPAIERAMTPGFENKMIAVKSWAAFTEGGKGGAPIVWLPVEVIGKIIEGCAALRKQLIEDIYQIYGLSDIMRGNGEANETATAQNIKAQFGSVRIRDRQQEIGRFCRDLTRMAAEIVATHFQPETLVKMTNMQLPTQQDVVAAEQQAALQAQQQNQQQMQQAQPGAPMPQPVQPEKVDLGPTVEDVFGLLKDGVLRRFRIDIEADSTIVGDESQERQDRAAFIEATTNFVTAWGPIVQQQPLMGQLAGQLLLFGVRAFRVGRELEETIEETVDKLGEAAKNPSPPQPSPDEQVKLEAVKTKTAAEIEKAQIGVKQAQVDGEAKMQQTQLDARASLQEHEQNARMMAMEQAAAERGAQLEQESDMRKHALEVDKMKMAAETAKRQNAQKAKTGAR